MLISTAPSRGAVDPAPCWCGGADWRLCFRTSRFGLVRCRRCGGYRLDPRPLQQPESVRRFYDEFYARLIAAGYPADAGGMRHSRFWRVARTVPPLRIAGRRAADVGSGDGQLCAELIGAGWRSVVGVEVSEARRAQARRAHPDIPFHASLEEARLAPDSLDLIVLDNVIEHLLDPAGMVAALSRSLASAGRLVLITPNMRS
ncbi:MAG TPA: methyltransferase domain-containing protein, partial [Gemmatimonadales bacterium]|nr:methyltransferase domain-containing protein [Gemmatimonadales bacterium]